MLCLHVYLKLTSLQFKQGDSSSSSSSNSSGGGGGKTLAVKLLHTLATEAGRGLAEGNPTNAHEHKLVLFSLPGKFDTNFDAL